MPDFGKGLDANAVDYYPIYPIQLAYSDLSVVGPQSPVLDRCLSLHFLYKVSIKIAIHGGKTRLNPHTAHRKDEIGLDGVKMRFT
jgi:hypothetical protein